MRKREWVSLSLSLFLDGQSVGSPGRLKTPHKSHYDEKCPKSHPRPNPPSLSSFSLRVSPASQLHFLTIYILQMYMYNLHVYQQFMYVCEGSLLWCYVYAATEHYIAFGLLAAGSFLFFCSVLSPSRPSFHFFCTTSLLPQVLVLHNFEEFNLHYQRDTK